MFPPVPPEGGKGVLPNCLGLDRSFCFVCVGRPTGPQEHDLIDSSATWGKGGEMEEGGVLGGAG